jgi:hypothetical protein
MQRGESRWGMAWRGRNRAPGTRYACGKLKPKPKPPEPEQPHRRGYGSNPLAETQHGRYFMDGVITGPQHVAGESYRRCRLRYRAALGITDSLSRGHREGDREDRDWDDAQAVADFLKAKQALGLNARDVDWVVGSDRATGNMDGYRRGLDCLRRLWGV